MVKKNQIKEVAWISDLHIGTVFYNPKIMEGVGKILSSRQDLSAVIIDGGLIPRVPSHFGRMNAQYFEILDQDIGAKYGKAVEEKVKKLHELKAGIEEEGKARVDSLDELIEVVQPEIKKMNLPAGDIVYYAWGEEDYSNVQDLIDTKIREYIVFKDSKADEIKEQLERSEETRKAKYEEITTKRKEVSKLKQQMKKGGDEKELEKANAEIQKLTGELEHLNIAYDSFKKHLANLESEKDAYSRGIRSFTKTWQLSPSEYSNPKKTGVKNRALKAYKELLYPMFKGKHLRLISHLEEIVNIDGLSLNISHNRNAISSNSILPSSLKNRVSQTKMKNRRGEKVADIDAEAHHGGFKIYAQKRSSDSNDTIYFLQVPPLQDPREVKKARERWVKTWDTKRYYDPFASGLTLTRKREDGVLEVEFYSSELLEKIATNGKLSLGKNVKIEIISDMHIGAPNERGYMTNYQMIEAIKKYQESRLPDIVVVGGDAINGEHLDQIIHEYLSEIPSKFEEERKKILSNNRPTKEKQRMLDELEKEQIEQSAITSISKQKQELKMRLYDPYWKKILEKGGEIIFVSGQHYNKSVKSKEDEATELSNMVDSEFRDRVHVFSGQDVGSGATEIKGLEIYAIHSPTRAQDEVTGIMNHMARVNRKADLAIGADYHQPGAGYADGTVCVAAAGLQPWTKYVDQIGKQGGVRGIINVYLSPENKGYAKFEFVFDEALEKVVEKK